MRNRQTRSFVCFVLASGLVVSACASGQIAPSDAACDRYRFAAIARDLRAAANSQAWRTDRLTAEAFRAQALFEPRAAASLNRQANAIVNQGGRRMGSTGQWSIRESSSFDQCRRAQPREQADGLDHELLESL
jgi:hypothetical protein